MDVEEAKAKLRDACLTPIHYRAVLALVDAIGQRHVGPAANAVLRRTIIDAAREAGVAV